MKKSKGFTLIEMLVVVSLIGILSGIALNVINIKKVQQRSRDSRRIGDIKRVQTALELYFADNRAYPVSISWVDINSASNVVKTSLTTPPNIYIDIFPMDPSAASTTEDASMTCHTSVNPQSYGYYYISNNTGGKYVLNAIMETTENADDSLCSSLPNCQTGSGITCNSSGVYCYCVQNPM